MEKIRHEYIQVNGLNLHVAQLSPTFVSASSPPVIFLHGFPEIWYSWRHQMIAVAENGFRAIAPDYRGYGLSDPPPNPRDTKFVDLVEDLLALLDALNLPKVFLVGKDFGAFVVSFFTLLHKERVLGLITLGVPFIPPHLAGETTSDLPEGFYINRWKVPGRAEADFGQFDPKMVVRKVYIMFSKEELPIAGPEQEIMDLVLESDPLPPWLSEEDLAVYGDIYQRSGFQTALQVPYRSLKVELGPSELVVKVPALLIMGLKDYVFKFPGMEDYIRKGTVKNFLPNLEVIYLPQGSHFVQEQSPNEVNNLILTFLKANV